MPKKSSNRRYSRYEEDSMGNTRSIQSSHSRTHLTNINASIISLGSNVPEARSGVFWVALGFASLSHCSSAGPDIHIMIVMPDASAEKSQNACPPQQSKYPSLIHPLLSNTLALGVLLGGIGDGKACRFVCQKPGFQIQLQVVLFRSFMRLSAGVVGRSATSD
jgi:hypothetical protein